MAIGKCARCYRTWREIKSRGMCNPCYQRAKNRGELVDYERTTRSADEVLDDWARLAPVAAAGIKQADLAARIGVSLLALRRHLTRARR